MKSYVVIAEVQDMRAGSFHNIAMHFETEMQAAVIHSALKTFAFQSGACQQYSASSGPMNHLVVKNAHGPAALVTAEPAKVC